ncbi:Dabb family protein [Bradyrhizobium glycinis]|uniref:Dabb family protein n=1 Tax=Bradyrhizobium glycinis TaxID=2751812 RepID=UPI0018D657AD|nr:Dabb family protein [Bradyrhizobium glycinis]MBH5371513.1 Dabb family protein [Bradyrhizobium glycinis]
MIRHIVLFTAKDKAHIDRIVEGLSVLTAIPHARRLEIARNRKTDQLSNDVDVVVYGEFDNEMELAAYKAHDLYQESIKQVRPLRELRFAADYHVAMDARCASEAAMNDLARYTEPTGGDEA